MTNLTWDDPVTRRFSDGVDRGVVFTSPDTGHAWPGLTSIQVDAESQSVTPYYYNGHKFYENVTRGDVSGTIEALYYPDAVEHLSGSLDIDDGFLAQNQTVYETCSLTWRTHIFGEGSRRPVGRVLHLLYNARLIPQPTPYKTVAENLSPTPFTWKFTAIPHHSPILRYEPTAYFKVDSRRVNADYFGLVESFLHGSDGRGAVMPKPEDFQLALAFLQGHVDGQTTVGDNVDGNLALTTILSGGNANTPY